MAFMNAPLGQQEKYERIFSDLKEGGVVVRVCASVCVLPNPLSSPW